ncbi:hypothetical protein KKF82_08005 [Patescibacteria group bacterium]|uniref:Uncharacterized protein n=1 Tax=viral metagenome TaxID=1070528 RepID=A0A6M3M4A5_9ZZZZ|nr:hypothetical protein [Patescibacteria group bacterium]
MDLVVIIVGIGSIIANILITALVVKLYTEYRKDVTIKRRYEEAKTAVEGSVRRLNND